jgi:acetoin utilization protein AcuB
MKVNELMSRDVKTAGPDEDARTVYKKFTELGIHHVPVVEGRKMVGIISTSDYRGVIHGESKGAKITADMVFGGLSVRALMTRNPLTVPPEATVQIAAQLMQQNQIHALPVIAGGELLGIITSSDILGAVSKGKLDR